MKIKKKQNATWDRSSRKNFYNINFTREIWIPTNVTVSNNNGNKASLLMFVQKAIIYRIDPRERFIRCGVSRPFGKLGSFGSERGKYTRTSF